MRSIGTIRSSAARALAIGAVVALSACSFTEDSLWPSLSGEDPSGTPPPAASQDLVPEPIPSPVMPATSQPPLGTSTFEPVDVTPGQPTGTFVGEKVTEMRGELNQLQSNISQHNHLLQDVRSKIVQDSQRYHGTVAAINARLQVGTTPGNPILVQQLGSAQAELNRVNANIGEMNKLATAVGSDATMSAYLEETARATFSISGAVDEDHRQLAILEDEVDRTAVLIDRLLREVSEDVRRQTTYVATERSNLNVLTEGVKTGEIFGGSLINQAMTGAAYSRAGALNGAPRTFAGSQPLVVVRFDRPNVSYEQALYNAVSRVLERQPGANFEVVAVAPNAGGPARVALNTAESRRLAEGVMRSLVEMGLPPSRVGMSGQTSDGARENEVHVFIR